MQLWLEWSCKILAVWIRSNHKRDNWRYPNIKSVLWKPLLILNTRSKCSIYHFKLNQVTLLVFDINFVINIFIVMHLDSWMIYKSWLEKKMRLVFFHSIFIIIYYYLLVNKSHERTKANIACDILLFLLKM